MMGLGPEATRSSGESLKSTLMGPGPLPQPPPVPAAITAQSAQSASLKNTFVGVGPSTPPAATASAPPVQHPSLKATLMGPGGQEEGHAATTRLSSPPELAEGTVFAGDLRIVRRIARGGMGTVYEAEQLSTGRRRALKILHRAQALDERQRQRFLQEARITSRIESEHIVDVVMAGADASTGTFWIVMELLDGETLAERLMRLGPGVPLPDAESWRILTQLARGLARAHAQGVVHRDLKPANVFLAKGSPFTVKLLDFGIAHLLDDDIDSSEGPLGTPLWMAPEQARRGEISPTADIWAVGLLGFRLFVGRSYWLSARKPVVDMSALLAEMLDRPLPTASERAEALGCTRRLPEGFDGWFARCVARDPGLRFRSADEMAIGLQQIMPDASTMPVIEYTPTTARQQTPVIARPYPRRDSARSSPPRARALVEEEARVPAVEGEGAVPSPIPLHRPVQHAIERRPHSEPSDRREPTVGEHPRTIPSPSHATVELHPASQRPPSPEGQTVQPRALSEPAARGPSLHAMIALGMLTGLAGATMAIVASRARSPTPAVPSASVPMGMAAAIPSHGAWVVGTNHVWNGRMQSEGAEWSFVMLLRLVEPGQVEGYVSWTALRAPNARPGEQVRENLEGNWDEATRTLELHGTASTNPLVMPVNAYRLLAARDGSLTGTSMDAVAQLSGHLTVRTRR